MISITTKSPYALQALAELGRTGGTDPVPIGELARRREIPVQFLEQLFAVLRRAGLLRSQRGVRGGYAFGRDATGIFAEAAKAARDVLGGTTIADVVEREARESGAPMYYI